MASLKGKSVGEVEEHILSLQRSLRLSLQRSLRGGDSFHISWQVIDFEVLVCKRLYVSGACNFLGERWIRWLNVSSSFDGPEDLIETRSGGDYFLMLSNRKKDISMA